MRAYQTMSSTFKGFSEEDIERLKSNQNSVQPDTKPPNARKVEKIGAKPRKAVQQYKTTSITDDLVEQVFDELNVSFDKCKLSLKPTSTVSAEPSNNNNNKSNNSIINSNVQLSDSTEDPMSDQKRKSSNPSRRTSEQNSKMSEPIESLGEMEPNRDTPDPYSETSDVNANTDNGNANTSTPDVVSSTDSNYNEAVLKAHTAKLEELQVKQKLMEEQNRRRKDMLAKALADRTKQTEEEVMKLEKIKKELLVLDGQLSQDVALLRKKIDLACLTYAEAEKHYLRVENEFLQAKLNLQKEKEKKELLTEHLYALITHNETRKAQKLVTLMERLMNTADGPDDAVDKMAETSEDKVRSVEEPTVVDGVDERTGKMVEMNDIS